MKSDQKIKVKWKSNKPHNTNQQRLSFPKEGDTKYFNFTGKRHYVEINNRSDQELFNPQKLNQLSNWIKLPSLSMSRQKINKYNDKNVDKSQQIQDPALKAKKQAEFRRKQKYLQTNQIVNRNHLRIFGSVQSIHQFLHKEKSRRLYSQQGKSKMNMSFHPPPSPTYISTVFNI